MTRARFIVTLPEGTWLARLSRAFPDATFALVTAVRGHRGSVGLLWITAPEVEPILSRLGSDPQLTHHAAFHRTDAEATVGFETDELLPFDVAGEAGVPIDTPVEVSDGVVTLDVIGFPRRIRALGQVLDARSIEFSIAHIRDDVSTRERLTQNQRALVTKAIEMGYYDTPRQCSLTELADAVGLAKSTISETLHRAEEVLIKEGLKTAAARREPVT